MNSRLDTHTSLYLRKNVSLHVRDLDVNSYYTKHIAIRSNKIFHSTTQQTRMRSKCVHDISRLWPQGRLVINDYKKEYNGRD